MSIPIQSTNLSKSILAGLLTGVIAAMINLIYVIIFRESSRFSGDEIIVMPLTIFVGLPILLVLVGCAYYLFQKHLISGTLWFVVLCLVGMLVLIAVTIRDTWMNTGTLLSGARGLFLGLVVITFLLAAFLLPYLARHSKIFL
jgi:hypothetical protein